MNASSFPSSFLSPWESHVVAARKYHLGGLFLLLLFGIPLAVRHTLAAPIDSLDPQDGDGWQDVGDSPIVPTTPEGLREISEAKKALASGNVQLCRDKLRVAYAKAPHLPPPKLMLARLMLSGGKVAAVRKLLEEVAVLHADHPELYVLFGKLALSDGRATDAALHFEKALSLKLPSNWNDEQRQYLQRVCLAGHTAIAERRGEWDAAVKLYQQRINGKHKDVELRDHFAMALFRAGKLEHAFEQFDVAYLQDNSMNRPEISMAVMYVGAANYETADQWFRKALEQHPDEAAVHYEHSIAMLQQDRTQEAADSAAKAAELGMNSPTLEMLRGLVALQQGDGAAAEQHFEVVLAASLDNVGAMSQLALLLVEKKEPGEQRRAVKLAETAAKMRPNSPNATAVLGWVYFRTRQSEKAQPLLRAAAAQSSSDPLPLFLYTRMLFLVQKGEEAQKTAELLRRRIEQPGLFAYRPIVRKWLATVLED